MRLGKPMPTEESALMKEGENQLDLVPPSDTF